MPAVQVLDKFEKENCSFAREHWNLKLAHAAALLHEDSDRFLNKIFFYFLR